MADISVSGRMTVKSLKAQFKKEFKLTLRVYNGARFAEEGATLASLRKGDASKSGDMTIRGNLQIGSLETRFMETYGIKVQVASGDDSKLLNNSLTLATASKEHGSA